MKDTEATADKQVPTFENLLLPIAHLENEWEFEKDCLEFLTLYSPDESLRKGNVSDDRERKYCTRWSMKLRQSGLG
jgi:hypothetical protein